MPTFRPVHNIAADGIEVTTDDGSRFQIVRVHGEATIYYIPQTAGKWGSWVEVRNPDRIAPNPGHMDTGKAKAGLLTFAQTFTQTAN